MAESEGRKTAVSGRKDRESGGVPSKSSHCRSKQGTLNHLLLPSHKVMTVLF